MGIEGWSSGFTAAVGRQVRLRRQAMGLTAAQLSEACTGLGVDVPSRTITNWETGKRATIAVTELMAVAEALGVAPIGLMFPLGQAEEVEVLPGREVAMWDAVAWFTDEALLEEAAPAGSARAAMNAYRGHAAAVHTTLMSLRIREERRRQAGANLAYADAMLKDDLAALRALREEMRADGLVPPPIPERLQSWWDLQDATTTPSGTEA